MFDSIKRFFDMSGKIRSLENHVRDLKDKNELWFLIDKRRSEDEASYRRERYQLIKEKGELLLMLKNLGINAVKKEK